MITRPAALAALLCLASALPAAAVEPTLYLRREFLLSPQPPTATAARDDGEVALLRRRSARLATFVSDRATAEVRVGDAVSSLYLVTRRTPMESCAVISVDLFRLNAANLRLPVASAEVRASILKRRVAGAPVVVPVPVGGVLAAAGERVGIDVSVTNDCDGARTVTLLYDSLEEPSAVAFTEAPAVTTTTTTTLPPGGPTTTTLPPDDGGDTPEPGCLDEAQTPLQRVLCRLDTIAAILREQPPDALGSGEARTRMFLRVERARAIAAAAAPSGRRPRLMARALRAMRRFGALVHRLEERGRIDPTLSTQVRRLAADAMADMRALRAPAR